jgi:hypothetical protein
MSVADNRKGWVLQICTQSQVGGSRETGLSGAKQSPQNKLSVWPEILNKRSIVVSIVINNCLVINRVCNYGYKRNDKHDNVLMNFRALLSDKWALMSIFLEFESMKETLTSMALIFVSEYLLP